MSGRNMDCATIVPLPYTKPPILTRLVPDSRLDLITDLHVTNDAGISGQHDAGAEPAQDVAGPIAYGEHHRILIEFAAVHHQPDPQQPEQQNRPEQPQYRRVKIEEPHILGG